MTQSLTTQRVSGLIPNLTDGQASEVRVLDGRNFDFTASGPRSAFGTNLVTPAPLQVADKFPQIFNIKNTNFIFDQSSVFKLNPFSCCFTFIPNAFCIYESCFRWSKAYVGDKYYFSRPDVGILEYDVFLNEWKQWTKDDFTAAQITAPIYGVTESMNRLIVLGSDTVSWSEIDRGNHLATDTYGTAGFQSLSLIEFGCPLGVYGSSQGFFTFTTSGTMFSRPTDDINPFSHSKLSTMNQPMNSFSITPVDDSSVAFLSKSGIYLLGRFSNNQFQNEKLEQLMGDYWNTNILPCLTTCEPNCALFYLQDEDKLFLSLSTTSSSHFDIAFVYNFRYKEWSMFNHKHRFIGQVHLGRKEHNRIANGYIDNNGFVHEFNHNQNFREEPISNRKLPLDSFIELGRFVPQDELQKTDSVFSVTSLAIDTKTGPTISSLKTCEPEVSSFKVEIADESCEYQDVILSRKVKQRQYFNLNITGEFFTLKLSAQTLASYYAVGQIELTAINAGRK